MTEMNERDWKIIETETGITNPLIVLEIVRQHHQIKLWVQELLTPDDIYLHLKDMFGKRINVNEVQVR